MSMISQPSIDTCTFLENMKVMKVAAIIKSGSKNSDFNFRLTSFTSFPCKILERTLYSNIAEFLGYNSAFTSAEDGFPRTLSSKTQLICVTHQHNTIFDRAFLAD